jgi:hypothetical protein
MAGLLGVILSHVSDLDTGFGLVILFIGLQLITESNYSAIANSHTLLFITAHSKSSKFVFTSLC